jgi:hypothetical protein
VFLCRCACVYIILPAPQIPTTHYPLFTPTTTHFIWFTSTSHITHSPHYSPHTHHSHYPLFTHTLFKLPTLHPHTIHCSRYSPHTLFTIHTTHSSHTHYSHYPLFTLPTIHNSHHPLFAHTGLVNLDNTPALFNLGNRFALSLDNAFDVTNFDSVDEALAATQNGENWVCDECVLCV